MANDVSPMMKQYWEIKRRHPNAILFFRVGDFYEMFHDDAVLASKLLEIALTSRDKNKENGVPLCGVPFHAASGYIKKLIKAGHAVAVCEQMEDPAAAKGVIRRDVLRVITPGTIIEPDILSPKENHYVAALCWDIARSSLPLSDIGLAFLDLSVGEFRFCRAERFDDIEGALGKISPKEIILPASLAGRLAGFPPLQQWPIRYQPPYFFQASEAYAVLRTHFRVHAVSALGEEGHDLIAAGALLAHVQEVQKGAIGTILSLTPYRVSDTMRIHPLAQRHLQLVPETTDGSETTLFQVLDKTATAMGGRALRHWLLHPLMAPDTISKRQEAVAWFYDNRSMSHALFAGLRKMADTERLIGRIGLNAANPRDLVSLKTSLFLLPEMLGQMTAGVPQTDIPPVDERAARARPAEIETLLASWDNLTDVAEVMDRALVADPPLSVKDGGFIREGYCTELDKIRNTRKNARILLAEMEQAERKRTGIESLKIRYNPVFGYSLEVTDTHRDKIPADYIRKQTLARAERFTIPPLMALEEELAGAEETIRRLETEAFEQICKAVAQQTRRIQEMAHKIATLDVFLALATAAHENRYVRPTVNAGETIRIVDGRHPVLEKTLPQFVPNDTCLDPPSSRLLLITGPNMAGKSTYMQQVALIVLMAQMGSFVPAREATIGVVDQIFTRVGAADAITRGMSTFMVEMTEMAQILRQATSKSLILLDELGRGTSTFDGMSIAWAIAEYLHRLESRTLFATHYHELTGLEASHPGIRNYHASVREEDDGIIFLRKIVEGGADKSYGIEVGRLAGLPSEILIRAKAILAEVSAAPAVEPARMLPLYPPRPQVEQGPQAEPEPSRLVRMLQQLEINTITPMQALSLLANLVEQAQKEYPLAPYK